MRVRKGVVENDDLLLPILKAFAQCPLSLRATRIASCFQSVCGSKTVSPTNSSIVREISGFHREVDEKRVTQKSTVLNSLVVSTIASSPPPQGIIS